MTLHPSGAGSRPALFVFLLILTNCGYPGPVLPPLLDIPLSVSYVNAVEYGDKILVQFTLPDLKKKNVKVDAVYVRKQLAAIVKDQDLSRYIL